MKVTADDDNRLPPGRTPRVLVVDDEESLRELLELTLVGMGLDVDVAEDLSTARAILERYRYSLCLTDMRLPDGSGLDLVEWKGPDTASGIALLAPVSFKTTHAFSTASFSPAITV